MLCNKCNGEMKEGFEIRNRVKVKTYKCPKCEKELVDFQRSLSERRKVISEKRQEKLKGIKGRVQRIAARRKL